VNIDYSSITDKIYVKIDNIRTRCVNYEIVLRHLRLNIRIRLLYKAGSQF